MSAPEASGQIEVEGRRLAWRSVGRGPRLLLLNGYAATGADWDPSFLAALGESFEVICPDNRGVGGSELGDEELSVEGMAADAEALLDALAIERAPVVGWSMGGFVAQRLAARSPRRGRRSRRRRCGRRRRRSRPGTARSRRRRRSRRRPWSPTGARTR